MKHITTILTLAVISLGVGRGWEHLFFDPPYREILWDETIMTPVVNTIWGITWSEYATNPVLDEKIQFGFVLIGWLYLTLTAIIVLTTILFKKQHKIVVLTNKIASWTLSLLVLILALLLFKRQFFHVGQLLENSLQVCTPVILYSYLKNGWTSRLESIVKMAISLTFGCHGLYAIGYYPVPGDFVEMTINIFNCPESTAKLFLKIIGLLDLVMSVLIFLPGNWKKFALIYIVAWGFITAFARLWGHWHSGYEMEAINKYWFQVVYRLPHALVPLVLVFKERVFQKNGIPGSR